MNVIIFLIWLAVIAAAGYLLTTRAIPWCAVKLGRLFGFSMTLNQITRKRIQRFKRIRRGYYAFLVLCTLFVLSQFLELLVSDKALFIYHNGRLAMPAFSEWLDRIPFLNISSYCRNADFGLPGDEPVHYRTYAQYCEDPDRIKGLIDNHKALLAQQVALLNRLGEPPPEPAPVPKPMFSTARPGKPPPDSTEEAVKAHEEKQREWKAAKQAYVKEHIHEYMAYEAYQTQLTLRADHQREQNVLATLTEELTLLNVSYQNFKAGSSWIIMPLYPHGPTDYLLDLPGNPPYGPSWWPHLKAMFSGEPLPEDPEERAKAKILPAWTLPLGSTDNGLDVVPQLLYGFRNSMIFALIVAAIGYSIGIIVGGIMGYYGGWVDIIMQRFIEIWGSIPFLFTIMIIASIVQPSLILLAVIMVLLRSWLGITYYIRGEFYREKSKDYVQSAIGTGVSDWRIITGHIIPNALVPVVTFAPFGIVGYILSLVSLDYLGFGLPPGTPSWGYLLQQGSEYLESYPHLILVPSLALAGTLFCVVIIGESVREAFDPKVFSRLR